MKTLREHRIRRAEWVERNATTAMIYAMQRFDKLYSDSILFKKRFPRINYIRAFSVMMKGYREEMKK